MGGSCEAPIDDFPWSEYDAAHMRESILAAREDPNAFIEYVGDGSGESIYQEEAHREWQNAITDNDKTVILAPVGSGKSTAVRMRLIWEIGRDPENVRIAYISQSEDHPKKQAASIREMIARNPRIHHVFPHLRRSVKLWAAKAFSVERDTMLPDPTFQVYGLYGKILGSRKTIIVLDDLCSFINTMTAASREKMSNWLAEVMSRLKGDIKVIAIGHIWDEDDALQRLVFKDTKRRTRRKGWAYYRYEATRPDGKGGEVPTFPRILPAEKIRELYEDAGPVFGQMMLWNRIPSATLSRFKKSWFAAALSLGEGQSYWTRKLRPCEVVTGVDLGHKKEPGKDRTVLVTSALYTDDTGHERRQVIDVRAGHWKGPEIIEQMSELRAQFDGIFFVESNGGQQYITDFALDDQLPTVAAWTSGTGANGKYGLEGVESGLGGDLRVGMWVLPCQNTPHGLVAPDEIELMLRGAHAYNPKSRDHTDDFLMAWWICRRGCEHLRPRHGAPPGIDHDPTKG